MMVQFQPDFRRVRFVLAMRNGDIDKLMLTPTGLDRAAGAAFKEGD